MQKAQNRFGQAIEAKLPGDRLKPSQPFEVAGINFAGHGYVQVGSSTRTCLIALFTCASTRALLLEMCSDMTADTFLQALQRFAGRTRLPHTIYTDNAQPFHAANRELRSLWQCLTASSIHNYLPQHQHRVEIHCS